jgi:RNA polymerase sigma-70 factor (ECF subfamily)
MQGFTAARMSDLEGGRNLRPSGQVKECVCTTGQIDVQNKDVAVIQRVLAGEKKAFSELIDRHKDGGMTLAMRMLKNREEAEEALQDAFVRAFNALPRFEWKSSFSTWFYRIVYNVCATQLSKRGEDIHVALESTEGEVGFEIPSLDLLPDEKIESSEIESVVAREIDALPRLYGSICTLFFLQDMSYDQIVEITGLPLGTVKVRLFRGRTLLRQAVGRQLGAGRLKEV